LLPVSGVTLAVGEPTGEDELFVVETALAPLPTMLELCRRVVRTVSGDPPAWPVLPATDLDAVALLIRRSWIGDTIRTDAICPDQRCRERIDVSFGIEDYLKHHRPRRPSGVMVTSEAGWFALSGATIRFRIPTVADMLEATAGEGGEQALVGRCVEGSEISRALARRVDRALSALAPSLEDLLGGSCPACGHEVTLRFDPLAYTLSELRDAFAGIHLETHALASAYGWPEATILALPRARRRRYASIVADERAAA
jgi:hypothetical protein